MDGPNGWISVGGILTNEEHNASAGDRTSAVARLLEIATHNADELLEEARAEAASILATAKADADQLRAVSEDQAEQLRVSASAEADRVLAAARAEQAALETEVARLQQLEQDHRDRMRSYLTEQLAQIEGTTQDEGPRNE
jgi:cell division septum initiation protein DivIVA